VPIYKKLKQKYPDVEIAFGYIKYAPQMRAGFIEEELKILEAFGEKMYVEPQKFNPDITFIADSVYPWIQNCGKLVNVGHGVLSKGQYYTDTATARREEKADLVCVPGKYHEHIMEQIVSTPVTATGMAKLDAIFDKSINRQNVLKQFGLSAGYRYILYAPTFNDELSAVPFVMDRINEVIPDEQTILIIKLHGSAKEEYKDMYKTLVQKDKRVIFADELDITPFLTLCDLMISDVSSAMMEFAALDKPLILFNNPNWKSYQNYNPEDIEFKWQDIGLQVTSLEEMKNAVKQCFANPEKFSEKRKFYTDQLFANKYEGNAAERIIEAAMAILSDTVKIKGAA
jgi:CDP-glycerol glycerophosphotransferase (TagB/SpsB family)